jgi:hypothetical protein
MLENELSEMLCEQKEQQRHPILLLDQSTNQNIKKTNNSRETLYIFKLCLQVANVGVQPHVQVASIAETKKGSMWPFREEKDASSQLYFHFRSRETKSMHRAHVVVARSLICSPP